MPDIGDFQDITSYDFPTDAGGFDAGEPSSEIGSFKEGVDQLGLATDWTREIASSQAEQLGKLADSAWSDASLWSDALAHTAPWDPSFSPVVRETANAFTNADSLEGMASDAESLAASAERLSHALAVVGAGLSFYEGYTGSGAQTPLGKATEATADTAADLFVGSNPVLATIDMAGDGFYSNLLKTGVAAAGALEDFAVNGDGARVDQLSQEIRDGKHGAIPQEIGNVTDYWKTNGLAGGVERGIQGGEMLFNSAVDQVSHFLDGIG